MNDSQAIKNNLSDLLNSQKLAVLSTNNDGVSYASLVAFITTDDMKEIFFATARTTRKFSNLISNSQVALLIDSRTNQQADFHEAIAVTAIGMAEEIKKPQKDEVVKSYINKHPHLVDFVKAPTCALIRVTVTSYYFVSRFQEVVKIDMR